MNKTQTEFKKWIIRPSEGVQSREHKGSLIWLQLIRACIEADEKNRRNWVPLSLIVRHADDDHGTVGSTSAFNIDFMDGGGRSSPHPSNRSCPTSQCSRTRFRGLQSTLVPGVTANSSLKSKTILPSQYNGKVNKIV